MENVARILFIVANIGALLFVSGWLIWLTSTTYRSLRVAIGDRTLSAAAWGIALLMCGIYWITIIPFVACILIALTGVPSWLPAPLLDTRDFIVDRNGNLYVDSTMICRIVKFNERGRFMASFPYPSGPSKSTQLAISDLDDIYFAARERIYKCDHHMKGELISEVEFGHPRIWTLTENGVTPSPQRAGDLRPNRAVRSGDLLFGKTKNGTTLHMQTFTCVDGSTVTPHGSSIEKQSAQGETLASYSSPLLLRLFAEIRPPWHAILGFSSVLLSAICRHANGKNSTDGA